MAQSGWKGTGEMTEITLYAIYANPSDYPNKYVVRKWSNEVPEKEPIGVTDTLKQARELIPDHCVNIGRSVNDDNCISECWM